MKVWLCFCADPTENSPQPVGGHGYAGLNLTRYVVKNPGVLDEGVQGKSCACEVHVQARYLHGAIKPGVVLFPVRTRSVPPVPGPTTTRPPVIMIRAQVSCDISPGYHMPHVYTATQL